MDIIMVLLGMTITIYVSLFIGIASLGTLCDDNKNTETPEHAPYICKRKE